MEKEFEESFNRMNRLRRAIDKEFREDFFN